MNSSCRKVSVLVVVLEGVCHVVVNFDKNDLEAELHARGVTGSDGSRIADTECGVSLLKGAKSRAGDKLRDLLTECKLAMANA